MDVIQTTDSGMARFVLRRNLVVAAPSSVIVIYMIVSYYSTTKNNAMPAVFRVSPFLPPKMHAFLA